MPNVRTRAPQPISTFLPLSRGKTGDDLNLRAGSVNVLVDGSPQAATAKSLPSLYGPEGPSHAPLSAMAKEERSEMREIIRRHLDNKGYVIRLTTHREGENLVGRVHVTDASSDETVAKVVGVGKVDHIELVFGVDASDGIARDIVNQVLNLADFLRYMVPSVSLKED